MQEIKTPEETLKQWREEFEKLLLKSFSKGVVQAEIDSDRWDKEWEFFLFAKTSSYEREQELIGDVEKYYNREVEACSRSLKLQERVKEQDEELQACGLQQHLFEKEIQKLQERINLLEKPDRGIDIVRGYVNRIESLETQLAKRDQLIDFAYETINCTDGSHWKKINLDNSLIKKWLKEVQELKEGK